MSLYYEGSMTDPINMKVKWSGAEYLLESISLSSTISELKDLISKETGVQPERQKLCGISLRGKS